MEKKSYFYFNDVMDFTLIYSILLRGIRARNMIGNAIWGEVMSKGSFDKFRAPLHQKILIMIEKKISVAVLNF